MSTLSFSNNLILKNIAHINVHKQSEQTNRRKMNLKKIHENREKSLAFVSFEMSPQTTMWIE